MDETVVRAMARWPDVPDCYGWLALTRRGEWRIGVQRERIAHRGLSEFINRNYLAGEHGAWFFQNGPQRVWVSLDYTPLVYRADSDEPTHLVAHTGTPAQRLERVAIDEDGSLILVTELGPGVLDDRDLAAMLPMIRSSRGRPLEDCLSNRGRAAALRPGRDAGRTPRRRFARNGTGLPAPSGGTDNRKPYLKTGRKPRGMAVSRQASPAGASMPLGGCACARRSIPCDLQATRARAYRRATGSRFSYQWVIERPSQCSAMCAAARGLRRALGRIRPTHSPPA